MYREVDCHLPVDAAGQHYWSDDLIVMHGPFATEAAAEQNFRDTVFGPNVSVTDGGMWDPKWDEKQ